MAITADRIFAIVTAAQDYAQAWETATRGFEGLAEEIAFRHLSPDQAMALARDLRHRTQPDIASAQLVAVEAEKYKINRTRNYWNREYQRKRRAEAGGTGEISMTYRAIASVDGRAYAGAYAGQGGGTGTSLGKDGDSGQLPADVVELAYIPEDTTQPLPGWEPLPPPQALGPIFQQPDWTPEADPSIATVDEATILAGLLAGTMQLTGAEAQGYWGPRLATARAGAAAKAKGNAVGTGGTGVLLTVPMPKPVPGGK